MDKKEETISPIVKEKAPLVLAEINQASSILLHCHPSPDPDSVGSVLAMKFALEQLGKKVTVIKGDSDIPEAFIHFPGAEDIVKKNFFELDLKDFDLFISLDSGSPDMISRLKPIIFPKALKIVVIDHHRTNTNYGYINLVDPVYPACGQILFDLFKEWGIKLTPEIAKNLFMGMYTDTGGFKYEGTTWRTFYIAKKLTEVAPDFVALISDMENTNKPDAVFFQGLAFASIETVLGGRMAISAVSLEQLKSKNIEPHTVVSHSVSSVMRTVVGWNICASMVETELDKIKISLRTRDALKYDVSKLAVALGGGGHKAAAGVVLNMSLEEAKVLLVNKAKELYE